MLLKYEWKKMEGKIIDRQSEKWNCSNQNEWKQNTLNIILKKKGSLVEHVVRGKELFLRIQ